MRSLALTALSYGRTGIGLSYEPWHATHIVLALLAVGYGLAHAIAFGFYLQSPDKSGLWVVLVVVWIGIFLYTRIVRPFSFCCAGPTGSGGFARERGDSVTLSLRPTATKAAFRAWAVRLALDRHAAPDHRPPVLLRLQRRCGGRGGIELTIRNLGDFTAHPRLRCGSGRRVWLAGPYGAFTMTRRTPRRS